MKSRKIPDEEFSNAGRRNLFKVAGPAVAAVGDGTPSETERNIVG